MGNMNDNPIFYILFLLSMSIYVYTLGMIEYYHLLPQELPLGLKAWRVMVVVVGIFIVLLLFLQVLLHFKILV